MLSFVNVYVEVAGPFALDSVTLCDDLLSDPYLVVGSFGQWNNLLNIEWQTFAEPVRPNPDATDIKVAPAEPHHGGCELSREVMGDKQESNV